MINIQDKQGEVTSMYDILITGANIVSKSTNGRYNLAIRDGKIAAILDGAQKVSAKKVLDYTNKTIIPGIIDCHAHFKNIMRPHGHSFSQESAAAIAGGVTTVLEMPVADPMLTSAQAIESFLLVIEDKSYTDYGLYAGAGLDNLEAIPSLAKLGIIGFKTFLHSPPPGREETLGQIAVTQPSDIFKVIKAVAETGLVHAIHAEEDSILHMLQAENMHINVGQGHINSRPPLLEDLAISTASFIGALLDAKLHFVHVTSPKSIDFISWMKTQGLNVSVETSPHYLTLTEEWLQHHGMREKCNPPLRSEEIRQELIARLNDGLVDVIASDHCAYDKKEVENNLDNFTCSPSGFPGIQYMLPSLLTLVSEGFVQLKQVVECLSSNVATEYGLPQKGDIADDFDADLVVLDLEREYSQTDIHNYSDSVNLHPHFKSLKFKGFVEQTILRGNIIYDQQQLVASPGVGKFVRKA